MTKTDTPPETPEGKGTTSLGVQPPPTPCTPGGGTIVSMPFKPVKPRFGGLSEIGTGVWAAWTGGKPAADWKGLADTNPKAIKPN